MRVIVFFDLPSVTSSDRREYTKFRKHLLKSGFIMMQESVYSKLAPNPSVANSIMRNVRLKKPTAGLIQMMLITEKQYTRIEFVIGNSNSQVLDTDERLVII